MAFLVLLLAGGCATLQRDPVSDDVVRARQMSLRGTEALHRGRWDEAESLFVEAIATCPADVRAHEQYASILWNRGATSEAVNHMRQAVRLSGGDPQLQSRLGEMYLAHGDAEQAWEQAGDAIKAQRDYANAWALRGDVLRTQGQSADAMVSYHRALSLQPRYPRVQYALSEIYLEMERPRRALSTLEVLSSSVPAEQLPFKTLYLRGLALKQLGRYDDAVETFVIAAAQQGERPSFEVLYQLAETQWAAGDKINARLALQAAAALAPGHSGVATLAERFQESTELAGGIGPNRSR